MEAARNLLVSHDMDTSAGISGGPVYLEKTHLEKQPVLLGIWKGGNFSGRYFTEDGKEEFRDVWNHATAFTQKMLDWM